MSLKNFVPPKKKAYYLFIFLIITIISIACLNEIEGFIPLEYNYFNPICQFIIYIPIFIYNAICKNKHSKKNYLTEKKLDKTSKFSNLDCIIFAFIVFLDLMKAIPYIFLDTLEQTFCLCSRYTIQIILITFFSKIYSNTRYYKHNIISQIMFTILGLLFDTILMITVKDDYPVDMLTLTTYFITIVIEAVVLAYKKYLFDVKLLTIEVVSSLFGIINFVFYVILFFSQYYFEKNFLCLNKTCDGFNDIELNFLIISVSFILNSLFYFLYYKIIYNFTPVHALLSISIFTFLYIILEYDSNERETIVTIYCIIFIFIFIFLLVFLEIIELNFWGLSKYTRRNILKRERKESVVLEELTRDSNVSEMINERESVRDSCLGRSIEIDKDYLLNINDTGDNE